MPSGMWTPLGAAKVVTPGTPVAMVSGAANLVLAHNCHSAIIQALPTITGRVFLLSNNTAADQTNYTNVLYVFTAAGQAVGQGTVNINNLDIAAGVFVDAANSGDGVLVSVLVL